MQRRLNEPYGTRFKWESDLGRSYVEIVFGKSSSFRGRLPWSKSQDARLLLGHAPDNETRRCGYCVATVRVQHENSLRPTQVVSARNSAGAVSGNRI